MLISFYELAPMAAQDVEDIFDYTEGEYGFDQAVDYVSGLEELFQGLVENPEMGKARNEIKAGLRSFPKGQHIIFYRILDKHIRIVRVLHASRDLTKFL